jgi:hypothetical protein
MLGCEGADGAGSAGAFCRFPLGRCAGGFIEYWHFSGRAAATFPMRRGKEAGMESQNIRFTFAFAAEENLS